MNEATLQRLDDALIEKELKEVVLDPSITSDMQVIRQLTNRAVRNHLLKLGCERSFGIYFFNTDKYISAITLNDAVYKVIRGFIPEFTIEPDDGIIDIRFNTQGKYLIEITKEQWPLWIGYEVRVSQKSGIDTDCVYTLSDVNIDEASALISSESGNQVIELKYIYIPARTDILSRKGVYQDMFRFSNFSEGYSTSFIQVLNMFLQEITDSGQLQIEYGFGNVVVFNRVEEE